MQETRVVEAEIAHLQAQIERLERHELDSELFKKVRLQYGIYSMRRAPTSYMVRVRVPLGIITADQLDELGGICERLTPNRAGHLTTRQDVQLYGITRPHLTTLLRRLATVGLTTREASGNVVRNVTCCPFAGIAPDEPFDITPYARAVSGYLLRNPLAQILPRKVKIAFEGCPIDHARTPIHDIGVVAAIREGRQGFRTYVGGGLGPAPRSAQLLEPWTSADLLIPTIEAILRVFDRTGERRSRARARLKFLVEQLGWDEFRRRVLEERQVVWATQSGRSLAAQPQWLEDPLPRVDGFTAGHRDQSTTLFERWARTNTAPQKQPGRSCIIVRVPLGDMTALQFRGMAVIARKYAGGVRLTNGQNLFLRSVPDGAIGSVYEELRRIGLAEPGAGRMADVTRCPGADTCLSAVTHPRGLAEALERLFHNGLSSWADADVSIKISGCPNSCGHHHIADLGFFGMAVKVGERHVPCYQVLIGGRTTAGQAVFGKRLLRVPAQRAPELVNRLVALYQERRQPDEAFRSFVDRVGLEELERALRDLADLTDAATQVELFVDLGDTEPFVLEAGKGECAE